MIDAAGAATDELTSDDRLFLNQTTGKLHRGKPGFLMTTACGLEVTACFVQFPALEIGHSDLADTCGTCFGSKKGRVLKARLSDQSMNNMTA